MNRVQAQSHPATQHQTEQDRTSMNQVGSQDQMTNPAVSQDQVTNPAVSQDQVTSQEDTHRRPAQGLTPPGEAGLSPSGVPPEVSGAPSAGEGPAGLTPRSRSVI